MTILQKITRCGNKCSGKWTNHLHHASSPFPVYPSPPLYSPCSQTHDNIYKEKSNMWSVLVVNEAADNQNIILGAYSFSTELFDSHPHL